MRTLVDVPPLPLRACDLCDHGISLGGMRYCVCTDVVMPEHLPQGLPVQFMRSTSGACGVEARYMAAPFLRR